MWIFIFASGTLKSTSTLKSTGTLKLHLGGGTIYETDIFG